jgi:hypothetical protein
MVWRILCDVCEQTLLYRDPMSSSLGSSAPWIPRVVGVLCATFARVPSSWVGWVGWVFCWWSRQGWAPLELVVTCSLYTLSYGLSSVG